MKDLEPLAYARITEAFKQITYSVIRSRNPWDERLPEVKNWNSRLKGSRG